MKRRSCMKNIGIADETKKVIRHHAYGQLTNEYDQEMKMDIWIIELKKKDMIIGQDGLETLESTINGKTKMLKIANIETEEIPDWLKDVVHVFDKFPEKEIPPERPEIDHAIELIQDGIPSSPLIPEKLQDYTIIRKYLDEMLRKNGIKVSNSTMRASMFLILKSGRKRPVIDYRKLNKMILKDSTTLPLIRNILDQIQGVQGFIKIDLQDIFNQIRIKKGDKGKTAFQTRYRTFEYNVFSFGLTNASEIFQQGINQILGKEMNMKEMNYIDNILVAIKIIKEYRAKIRRILKILAKTEIRTKLVKCEFEKEKMTFLKHHIDRQEIRSMKEKLQILRK